MTASRPTTRQPASPAPEGGTFAGRLARAFGPLWAWRPRWPRDGIGAASLIAAVLVGLALVTFDAADVPALAWPAPTATHNLTGAWGAAWAAKLLLWFGAAAYLIPLVLIAVGAVFILLPERKSAGEANPETAGSGRYQAASRRLVTSMLQAPVVNTGRPVSRVAPDIADENPEDADDSDAAPEAARERFRAGVTLRMLAFAGIVIGAAMALGSGNPVAPATPATGGVVGIAMADLFAAIGIPLAARLLGALLMFGAWFVAFGDWMADALAILSGSNAESSATEATAHETGEDSGDELIIDWPDDLGDDFGDVPEAVPADPIAAYLAASPVIAEYAELGATSADDGDSIIYLPADRENFAPASGVEPAAEPAAETAEMSVSSVRAIRGTGKVTGFGLALADDSRPESGDDLGDDSGSDSGSRSGIFARIGRAIQRRSNLSPNALDDADAVPIDVRITLDDLAPVAIEHATGPASTRLSERASARASQSGEFPTVAVIGSARESATIARIDSDYELPAPTLLSPPPRRDTTRFAAHSREIALRLQETLAQFKVAAEVTGIERGPTVTLFVLELAPGTKLKRLTGLSDDISMALRVESVRIVAPIPNRGGVGVEIPNVQADSVTLREMLSAGEAEKIGREMDLPFVIGVDSVGEPVVADLAKMPHLLIAGTTGSGKSVAANSLVLSLLFTKHYEDVRLVVIDPKMVEFAAYRDIPQLLLPVVTDNREAAAVLHFLVEEMERRYAMLERMLCKHISEFNALSPADRIARQTVSLPASASSEPPPMPEKLPFVVAIVDELADLMMVAGKDVETAICRLAQKSRAVGIHLVLATQRPSVDVITGLIKANIPCRLAFRVLSGIDSKTILDRPGAERLLGHGDALFMPAGRRDLVRCQGAFVSNAEILKVVKFVKDQARADYIELPMPADDADDLFSGNGRAKGRKKHVA